MNVWAIMFLIWTVIKMMVGFMAHGEDVEINGGTNFVIIIMELLVLTLAGAFS